MLSPDARPLEPDRPLTPAERRVAFLLLEGLSYHTICNHRLHISIYTLRQHMDNAAAKFPKPQEGERVGARITLMTWAFWQARAQHSTGEAA